MEFAEEATRRGLRGPDDPTTPILPISVLQIRFIAGIIPDQSSIKGMAKAGLAPSLVLTDIPARGLCMKRTICALTVVGLMMALVGCGGGDSHQAVLAEQAKIVEQINAVIMQILRWVIKVMPIGIFAILMDFTLRLNMGDGNSAAFLTQFRIPISFVLRSIVKVDSPRRPRQEMKIESPAMIVNT